ncbi:excitatory amino acid transporter 5-like isoform X5 [Poeciliopsis prolifica]|uniref:excitatory amino acid transporter 5-like isoform X5 n=1 Tax=Poeciliopsis prolifica TaxID=188132 RepID=UPI00241392C3|nr:excitatory amino acid transporter 5-like isoform X5 [Poeciliopsis prolifica]
MEEAGCPAPRWLDDPAASEAMDELLLPGEEEEARCGPAGRGPAGRAGARPGALWVGARCRNLRGFCRRNGLLTLSVIAVVTGCTLGFALRGTELSTQAKIYFSFPGELLMRMLKMLILPLITSSLMSGLSSMESKACCRMGVLTVTYYLWTTFIAVVVGIILVLIIKPGTGTEMESNRLGGGPVMTSADALLDLIRNMVPSNLIEATFQQYKTDLIPILRVPTKTIQPNFVYVVPDDNDPKGQTVYLELTPPPDVIYKTSPGSSQQMNVLGIVIFSATMGLLLGRMGERGAPLVNVCQCINECVMKIINAAVWTPLCPQVLPVWDHLLGGREDPGHAGPEHAGQEAGLVWHHRPHRPLRPRPRPPASLLLPPHREEPVQLHPGTPAGHGHRAGHLLQLRHAAHHHEVPAGELPRRPADRPLRPACGSHHQHGRHGAVRGCGGHLYRSSQRLRAGPRPAGHHQHHGHGRQHRSRRHPSGRTGYHGDRPHLRGPAA